MTGFAFSFALRYWKQGLIVAAVMIVLGYHWNAVRQARNEGYKGALEDIEAAAKVLGKKADEGTKSVNECFDKGEPWIWKRDTGTCVKP